MSQTEVYGASSFQYDAAGRMTQAVTPSGEVWQHAYQPNGWLLSSTSPTLSVAYTYNSRGFLTGLTNTSLLTSTPLSAYSGFSYDAVGNRLGFSAAIPALGYYDTNGNPITTQPLENYTSSFSYDTARPFANMNRDVLTQELRGSASVGQYNYDAAYNDVPVNEDNQITSNGSIFDGQGNPTTYVNEPLTFDAENRLTSINGTEQFTYDGEGHRFSKSVSYSPYYTAQTYYTYSGNTLISEDSNLMALFYGYTADGLRSAEYAPTPNYTTLEGAAPSQTSQFDFLYDPQGNLVQRTDNTELGVDQFTAYNAYGYPISGQSVGSQYGYTKGLTPSSVGYGGQYGYYNDGNGLLLLGARYYDPGARRFLNRDPIGYKGGSNLYAFCGGNPVNEIDPDGTDANAAADFLTGLYDPINPFVVVPGISSAYKYLTSGHASAAKLGSAFVGQLNPFASGISDREQGRRYSSDVMMLAAGAGLFSKLGGIVAAARAAGTVEEVGTAAGTTTSAAAGVGGTSETAGQLMARLIPEALKNQASDAFRDNSLLEKISPVNREIAAKAYKTVAKSGLITGKYASLAVKYNLARAQFLRGQIPSIPGTAKAFEAQLDEPK